MRLSVNGNASRSYSESGMVCLRPSIWDHLVYLETPSEYGISKRIRSNSTQYQMGWLCLVLIMPRINHRTPDQMRAYNAKRRDEKEGTVAVIDFETDPFDGPGNAVEPFAAGFYDGITYHDFWGNDCVGQLLAYIQSLETKHIIYAHNGGKFDFMFLLDYLEKDLFCIGTRIVRAKLRRNEDSKKEWQHELRDSFSIVPVALKDAASKMGFDYSRMKKDRREKWKTEIREYLKQDCVGLYETVTEYRKVFGNALTMASAAMKKLNQAMKPMLGRHSAAIRLTEREDEFYRQWFFGGRVQCFQTGIVEALGRSLKIFDINSSYPHVMRDIPHPVGASFRVEREISEYTDFVVVDATSDGALPRRNENNGKLDFPNGRYTFYATGHEVRAALDLGMLKIHKVIEARTCSERSTFAPFIDTYWEARKIARSNGLEVYVLFWKLVMNGAYGKFAQNPREFKDTLIVRMHEDAPDPSEGWELKEQNRASGIEVYTRRLFNVEGNRLFRSFLNVATGASITGAARASLLRGIYSASRPIYCDTDSVICEGMGEGISVNSTELGGWKLEHEGTHAAICARKLYGFFGDRSEDAKVNEDRIRKYGDATCIKIASKGVRLTAAQILDAARGEVVEWHAEAPTFRRDGSQWWQHRRVRMG